MFFYSIDWPKAGGSIEQCLLVYKSCFILNHLSNLACGQLLAPAAKVLFIVVVSGIGFGLVNYWNHFSFIVILLFLGMIVACVSMIIPSALAMCATYNYSLQFSTNMRERIHALENRDFKALYLRQVRSCQLIRCQVGNLYHMEGRAKLRLGLSVVKGFRFLLIQRN
jgi:hypothetical protein